MKTCSYCGKEYADEVAVCLVDGEPLVGKAPAPAAPKAQLTYDTVSPDLSMDCRAFRYLNILVSEKGVAEMYGEKGTVYVSKSAIQELQMRHGSRAERPVLQGLSGGLLVLLVPFGIYMILTGGLAILRWEFGAFFFGFIGGWLLWEALIPHYYLLVICADDRRKLGFSGKVQKGELEKLVRLAEELGYVCKSGV